MLLLRTMPNTCLVVTVDSILCATVSNLDVLKCLHSAHIKHATKGVVCNGGEFRPLKMTLKTINDVKLLKSRLIVSGRIRNRFVAAEFIKSCNDLGAPELALSTFNTITIKPSLYLQNLIIRCLCNHGLYKNVLCVYAKCKAMNCPSDNFTFPFVITACSVLDSLKIGKSVHAVVYRTGFDSNVYVLTALVDFYAKKRRMEIAETVFDRMAKPDLVSWNALISGYSFNGIDRMVFEVFDNLCVSGLKPNVSTFASLIPVCTRARRMDKGKSVHGLAVKYGLFSNNYLIPALISMYAGDGDLSSAINLFSLIGKDDVIIWNSMISAYAQNKEHHEAFRMFKLMFSHANLKPNMVSFVSIIPSCENFDHTWIGESIHACVVKNGFANQVSVATAFVSMYSRCGDLVSAKAVFQKMPQRNLLSWNCIVYGCVHNEDYIEGLAMFREMQFFGFGPDAISIISILSACSRLEATKLGKSAHAYSLKFGLDLILNVSNALLAFYVDTHLLSSSFQIFNKTVTRNVISWNTLISGLVHIGETGKAISLFERMQQEGTIRLDSVTLISIIPCCDKPETLGQGMAFHGYAIKCGVASVSLVNALVSMYFNSGDISAGKSLFDDMPERSVVSWNALVTGYRNHNLHNEAMVSFRKMMMEGTKPNQVTFLNLLHLCCTQLTAKAIHAHAVRTMITLQTPFLTSLICTYGKFQNIRSCFYLFEMGRKKNILFWNAMISVYVQTKNPGIAVQFFTELLKREFKPDKVTILSLISACTQLASLNFTNSINAYVIQFGFNNDVAITNALIDSYAKCGSVSFARELFEELMEKDSISWSVMINAYGVCGDGEAALSLFYRMKLYGVKLDEIIYLSLLSACSHAGLIEQGQIIFNSMLEEGKQGLIIPKIDHYACMVDLLGRKGYLKEAYQIVNNLPCKPSLGMLESLLGSCKVHENLQLGEHIGTLLYELDPENPGLYVILSNMYASVGKWMDVASLRSYMEMRQLRKVTGSSQIK